MKRVLAVFTSRWVLSGVGALALALLVWFLAPLFDVFAAFLPRLILIALIAVCWLVVNLVLDLRAAQRNTQMIAQVTEDSASRSPREADRASAEETHILRERLEEALAELKRSRPGSRGRQYLYELPWYILIGPPGSGKTTALVNSGLNFPLSDKFGKDPLRGVGGTRNCDWWFCDDAILLDTAGRYTTQDSNEAADQQAWLGFLKMLKQHRPRQPVNGVLIAIGIPDLLQMPAGERSKHARAIKSRLGELQQEFGMRLPVYVVFTKADRIAGFTEFFGDLDRHGRMEVWGTTFPLERSRKADDLISLFDAEFDEIMKRLNDRVLDRVNEERDPDRRGRAFGFPVQFNSVKPLLRDFLREAFESTRFEEQPLLRGAYFTSATQEGTPIDRLMGAMARAFGLADKALPSFSGVGRSYFLTRLLTDVVFEEASLAGANPNAERRERFIRQGALAAVAAVCFIVLGAWTLSYLGNRTLIADEERAKDEYISVANPLIAPTVSDDDVSRVMPVLDQLRGLPAGYDSADQGAAMIRRFGLNTSPKLESQAVRAYYRALNSFLLPRLLVGVGTQLRNNIEKPDFVNVFLPLYLMLGGQGPVDKDLAKTSIVTLWGPRAYPNLAPQDSGAKLARHVDALLQQPMTPIALDGALIVRARQVMASIPVSARAYAVIKDSAGAKSLPEWRVVDHAGAQANQVLTRASGKPLSEGIPGFFTYDGLNKVLLPQIPAAIKQVTEASWVLGPNQQPPVNQGAQAQLRNEIAAAYASDFITAWDQLLSDVTITPFKNAQDATDILGRVSGPGSPLKTFLIAAAQETTMNRGAAAAALANPAGAAAQAARGAINSAAGSAAGVLNSVAPSTAATTEPASAAIDAHFRQLHEFVAGAQTGMSQLDGVLKQLSDASAQLASLSSGGAPPNGAAAAQLSQLASRLPPPLGGIVAKATGASSDIAAGASRKSIQDAYVSTVLPLCRQALDGRYPFIRTSSVDIGLGDFQQLFKPGGVLDNFFSMNLKQYVDTSKTPWANQKVAGADLGLSRATLAQFETAQRIRDNFFSNGGNITNEFTLTPAEFGGDVSQVVFDVGGQVLTATRGQTPSVKIMWPPQNGDHARLTITHANGQTAAIDASGPWALFRLLDKARIDASLPDQMTVAFDVNGTTATFRLRAQSVRNPFHSRDAAQFQCLPQL
ncbi:MAG: type VI secretion system membrane subunit TssM [Alphaproteobacteria bacterium]|nr:type VI secretion system membrane subunit TssM [Alphaproteobacteria bacterium]